MSFFGNLIEEEIILDEFGNRRNRRSNDIVSDMFQVEAVENMMEGNFGQAMEDEFLADVF
jgi:hypothetical protein